MPCPGQHLAVNASKKQALSESSREGGRGLQRLTKNNLWAPEVVEEALGHAGALRGPPPHHPNSGKMGSQLGSRSHCCLVLFFSHPCLF